MKRGLKKSLKKGVVFLLMTAMILTTTVMGPITSVYAADATASILFDNVIESNYLGVGIQWDPNASYLPDYTTAQWNMITSRVDFYSPKFVRCMIDAKDVYISGLDGNGNVVYDWNMPGMTRVCKILDYCQSKGITVMFGEWFRPSWANTFDDWRWIKGIGDLLNYFKNTKGYTCIKYYNFVNEPNGDWMYPNGAPDLNTRWSQWSSGVNALYNELNSRGFLSWIKIGGPDSAFQDDWVDKTVDNLKSKVGQYEFHEYVTDDSQVTGGSLEGLVASKRSYISNNDAASKILYLGELGIKAGGDPNYDCQPRVKNFDYGVLMADSITQMNRAGGVGAIPWDLDDSMHAADPNKGILKLWGFWNTYGGQTIGQTYYPQSDQNLRPWYYTMSLYSRLFQQGWQTVDVNMAPVSNVRITAAKHQNGSNWDLSIAVVNDSDTARSVLVQLPGMTNTANFQQYNYFSNDMPVDGNGFPKAKMTRTNNLSTGVQVDLPSKGVVFLTTTNGGSTVAYSGATAPVGKTIWLKAKANGKYVSAWSLDPNTPLEARSTSVAGWEQFDCVDAGNGYIALKAHSNNYYVSSWIGNPTPLQARSTSIGTWEKFKWFDAGNGYIGLRSQANNQCVSTWSDTNNPLQARAISAQDWEMFSWGQ